MVLRKLSPLFFAVLAALSIMGFSILPQAQTAYAKANVPANLYGPVAIAITSRCPSAAGFLNLPVDSSIKALVVSGQVTGNVHLYDKNQLINTNVTGSAPYSFTTTRSDILYACNNDGSNGTVSFQGQLNMNSSNWAGYTVEGFTSSPNQYQIVTGDWNVPAVSCKGLAPSYDSAAWIGLGGAPNIGSSKIEQIGTEQDCTSTIASYHGVYENYPAGPITIYTACNDSNNTCGIAANVNAGDQMHAEVSHTGNGQFRLFEHNLSKGWYINIVGNEVGGADASVQYSAEWILEYPHHAGSWGLANFVQVTFQNCYADGFTIKGAGPSIQDLTMKNSSGNIMASTTPIFGSGNSFSMNFVRS